MNDWMVFDGSCAGDPSSEVIQWMAEQTERACDRVQCLRDDAATRHGLEEALKDDSLHGVALFGHGTKDALIGTDGQPALDKANLAILSQRWAHALACRTGVELAGAAAQAGATCFVGYEVSLIVEFDPSKLPLELSTLLARLVTAVTLALAGGTFDESELLKRARVAADAVVGWLIERPDGAFWGVEITAHQLVRGLVVR